MESRYVERFSASERVAHWLHALAFIVLLGTGSFLYVPALQSFTIGTAGQAARLAHRIGAAVFMASPLLYLIGDPRGFVDSLRQSFSWRPDDFRWLRLAWRYYTQGARAEGIPPQGKYNAGQKLNALTQIIAFVLFTVTGLTMWFGYGIVSPTFFRWAVVIHDLSVIAVLVLFMVHLYQVAVHPFTRESIMAMFEGVVTREYAQEHHAQWYEEVKASGKAK